MPKSAAERQRERRLRLRLDDKEYSKYKKADADRKRKRRATLDADELNDLRKKTKLATRKWRTNSRDVAQNNQNSNIHAPVDKVFKTPASFGKARRKVERALPKSPRKKVAVVKKLACEILKMKGSPLNSRQNTTTGIDDETFRKVKEFYELDCISRVMPGKADVITIRCADGTKQKTQKRHMTMTISEAFEVFKADNPTIKIGKSKFAEIRPGNVLLSSKMPHNVCGCKYHNNITLMLESLHRFSPDIVPLYSNDNLLVLCVCDIKSEECMSNNCSECKDGKFFHENIVSKLDLTSTIKWYQWGQDESGYLEKLLFEGTVEDAMDTLNAQLSKFLWHVFIKRKQAMAYEQDKLTAKEADSTSCILQMDFSENFTVSSQDEIQSAHWKQRQITLYTITIWHRERVCSWVIASDVRSHDKKLVAACTSSVLDYIGKELPSVKTVKIWTDGPSSQFKNKYIFALIPRLEEHFKLVITWNFFATSHGKGPNDALGGQAKRIVHQVIMTRKEHTISGADSFIDALLLHPLNFRTTTVSVEDIENWCKILSLDHLWENIPAMTGITNTHCVMSGGDESVACRFYTLSQDIPNLHRIRPLPGAQDVLHTETVQRAIKGSSDAATSFSFHLDEVPSQDAPGEATMKTDGHQLESVLVEPTKPIDLAPQPGTSSGSIITYATGNQQRKRKRNHLQEMKAAYSTREYPCPKCDWVYGDENDPNKLDEWLQCIVCMKWFHETCAEDSGIIDDEDKFTCLDCL